MVPLVGSGSHYTVMLSIAEELFHRQHNITMLVSRLHENKLISSSNPVEKHIHYVYFKNVLQEVAHQFLFVDMNKAGKHVDWIYEVIQGSDLAKQKHLECEYLLQDTEVLNSLLDCKFDILLVDSYFNCPIVQFINKQQRIPYIVVSAVPTISSLPSMVNRFPYHPSYMPELTSGLTDRMTFIERLINTATSILFMCLFTIINAPYQIHRDEHDVISDTTPYYSEADLFLVNTHFSLDYPRPLMPNTVVVGGITTKPNLTLSKVRETYNFSIQVYFSIQIQNSNSNSS